MTTIDLSGFEQEIEKAAQALFDDKMGGTDDIILIDMLASLCRADARAAIKDGA